MRKLLTILSVLCAAAINGWCKSNDSLKGASYYAVGRTAFNGNDYATALANLSTFKKLNGANLQSQYAFAFNKVEQGINLCLEQIDDASHQSAVSKAVADSLIRRSKYRLALPPRELLEALGNTSDSGNAISQLVNDSSSKHFYLALIERQKKHEDFALAHFEKSVSLDSTNGAASLELAVSKGLISKASLGQTVTFSEVSRSITKKDTQIILSAYIGLANKNFFEKKYAEAWKYYEKAAIIDPRRIEAQTGIAEVCLKMNRTAPALKAMEAIAALHPGDYENQWKLVHMYYNYGQYDKVIAMVPALHLEVANAKGWAFMLGKAYHERQNYGKAIQYMQLATTDEPDNSEAPYLIARMLVQMENYKQAIIYYKKSLAIDSVAHPDRMYELAVALGTAQQFSESFAYFKKALDGGYKASHDFYTNMAHIMADAHKMDEAVSLMKDLLSTRPADIALINALGELYYNAGNYKDAINTWNRLMATDDKNARTLYHIGSAYIKMGKGKEGRSLCNKAVSIDPSLSGQMANDGIK